MKSNFHENSATVNAGTISVNQSVVFITSCIISHNTGEIAAGVHCRNTNGTVRFIEPSVFQNFNEDQQPIDLIDELCTNSQKPGCSWLGLVFQCVDQNCARDACTFCEGDNSTCAGCDGIPYSNVVCQPTDLPPVEEVFPNDGLVAGLVVGLLILIVAGVVIGIIIVYKFRRLKPKFAAF